MLLQSVRRSLSDSQGARKPTLTELVYFRPTPVGRAPTSDFLATRRFGDRVDTRPSCASSARAGRTVTSQKPVVGFRRARSGGIPKTITSPTAPSRARSVRGEHHAAATIASCTFASQTHQSALTVNKWFTIWTAFSACARADVYCRNRRVQDSCSGWLGNGVAPLFKWHFRPRQGHRRRALPLPFEGSYRALRVRGWTHAVGNRDV